MSDATRKFKDFAFASRFRKLLINTDEQSLAQHLGIQSTSTFRQWSNGYTLPTCENLYKLAVYFGVTTDYLLGRKKSASPDDFIEEAMNRYGLSEKALEGLALWQEIRNKNDTNILSHLLEVQSNNKNEFSEFVRLIGGIEFFITEHCNATIKTDIELEKLIEHHKALGTLIDGQPITLEDLIAHNDSFDGMITPDPNRPGLSDHKMSLKSVRTFRLGKFSNRFAELIDEIVDAELNSRKDGDNNAT